MALAAAKGNRPSLRFVSTDKNSDAAVLACGLYHATLALLHASDQPARESHRLVKPLSQLVARQKTRIGQKDCALFAKALLAGDHDAALEACRRLIESAGNGSA